MTEYKLHQLEYTCYKAQWNMIGFQNSAIISAKHCPNNHNSYCNMRWRDVTPRDMTPCHAKPAPSIVTQLWPYVASTWPQIPSGKTKPTPEHTADHNNMKPLCNRQHWPWQRSFREEVIKNCKHHPNLCYRPFGFITFKLKIQTKHDDSFLVKIIIIITLR
jgi:hypothetical protein